MCALKLDQDEMPDASKQFELVKDGNDSLKQINLMDLGKDELIDMLKSLETELEACEIACNILKVKSTKDHRNLKYTCYEALLNDDKLFENVQNFEKLKTKTMKNYLNDDKKALNNVIFTNEECFMALKSHITHLEDQHFRACSQLADDKKQWIEYQDKFCKFQAKATKDLSTVNSELDMVTSERNQLLDKLQTTEENLIQYQNKCKYHQDGANLLADERLDLFAKINLLAGSVDFLENSIEKERVNSAQLFDELKKSKEENERLKHNYIREIESLSRDYENILATKDNRIKELEQDLNKKSEENYRFNSPPDSNNISTDLTLKRQQPQQQHQQFHQQFHQQPQQHQQFQQQQHQQQQFPQQQHQQQQHLNNKHIQYESFYDNVDDNATSTPDYNIATFDGATINVENVANVSATMSNAFINNRQVASSNDLYNMMLSKDITVNGAGTIRKNYSAANSIGLTPNSSFGQFDIFGPEMANLQELLVFPSLNGGPNYASTPKKETSPPPPPTTTTTSTIINNNTPTTFLNNSLLNPMTNFHISATNFLNNAATTTATTSIHNNDNIPTTTTTTTTTLNTKQLILSSIQFNISNDNPQILREILKSPEIDRKYFREKLPNGLYAQHYAVECCADECLKVLLESGYDVDVLNADQQSPMHMAAMEGNILCLNHLIAHGGPLNAHDHIGMTPLHWASNIGHVDCCVALLQAGACIDAINSNHWTPIHTCIFSGHSQCLKQLLTFKSRDPSRDASYEQTLKSVVNMADEEGKTAGHLAAVRQTKDCLEILMKNSSVNLHLHDKSNKSPVDVASSECLGYIYRSETSQEITCVVSIDIESNRPHNPPISKSSSSTHLNYGGTSPHHHNNNINIPPSTTAPIKSGSMKQLNDLLTTTTTTLPSTIYSNNNDSAPVSTVTTTTAQQKQQQQQSCAIGNVVVSKSTNWPDVEEKLSTIFLNHISEVSIGLRTKKITKSENQESSSDPSPNPFTMGITLKSIKYYSIGKYHWSPGKVTEKSPYELLNAHNTNNISVTLFGMDNDMPDSLAYESMVPIYILLNYLKMIQQHKCIVFYGAKGMGKSYLADKLARYIQVHESTSGVACDLHLTNLNPSFTSRELLKLLIDKNCLIDAKLPIPPSKTTILIFDDLTQVTVDEVFKDVAQALENRGPAYPYVFKTDNNNNNNSNSSYYMHPNCYIICTMDRPKSAGIDILIQQRFKWLQLRCDQEPCRYLLHRHLLRDLSNAYLGSIPMPDNSVYKAVEWLICVWQRLNEGVAKLGLNQLTFGPCYFLSCPIERNKPKAILRWMISLWNKVIAPEVSQAIVKSSKSSSISSELQGQQKVTNTALYVLMQRAVVSGCPLTNQERDRYLSSFYGSNELDIKIKNERYRDDQKSLYSSSSLSSPSSKASSSLSSPPSKASSSLSSPTKSSSSSSSSSSPFKSASFLPLSSLSSSLLTSSSSSYLDSPELSFRGDGGVDRSLRQQQQNYCQQILQQQLQQKQQQQLQQQQQQHINSNNAQPLIMSRSFNNKFTNNDNKNMNDDVISPFKSSTDLNKTAPNFNTGNNFATTFNNVAKTGSKLATPLSTFNVMFDPNVVVKQPTK